MTGFVSSLLSAHLPLPPAPFGTLSARHEVLRGCFVASRGAVGGSAPTEVAVHPEAEGEVEAGQMKGAPGAPLAAGRACPGQGRTGKVPALCHAQPVGRPGCLSAQGDHADGLTLRPVGHSRHVCSDPGG